VDVSNDSLFEASSKEDWDKSKVGENVSLHVLWYFVVSVMVVAHVGFTIDQITVRIVSDGNDCVCVWSLESVESRTRE
jgi:hypothetical protein